ncbi:MAG: bifunctional nicotinamidase/pyrazinamidase [Sandaracinaceae bacterium]
MPEAALLLVDLQNDFLPGGALAVSDGDAVLDIANALIPRFTHVVATQDWHPAGHESFASQHAGHAVGDVIELHGLTQVLWPDHCVQGSPGAAFAEPLRLGDAHIVPKGMDPRVDSYSGFFDNGKKNPSGLTGWLRDRGVEELFVLGLATDYCVKFTALDALEEGFRTTLVEDGCRGVELAAGDCKRALDAMREAGVSIAESASLLR